MNQRSAHACLLGAAFIYGANYCIAKSVMPEPLVANAFIVLRATGAAVLFWIIAAKKITIPDTSDWWRLILCALTGVCINQLCFFNGLALTSPINSSIMMTSNPILVMLISALMLRQRITLLRVIGIICGASGAILLLTSQYGTMQGDSTKGDIFILINSISWAFYLVLVVPLMKKYHPTVVAAWVFLIGSFMVFPVGADKLSEIEWSQLSHWQWFCLIYVVLGTTFLAYLLNMLAVSRLSPTTVSSYIYLQPFLAGIFSRIFDRILGIPFDSSINPVKAISVILIFLGVYLVSRTDIKRVDRFNRVET
jgi:drug/metabolite transporter (DMT)-like permease